MNAGCEDDNEAEFSDDEELELFLKAYDEGQVRICCEWTAAPLTSERRTEAVDEPYRRKVAVWKRPWAEADRVGRQQQQQETTESDAMDDDDDEDLTRALDDWEQEEEQEREAIAKAVDCAIQQQQQQQVETPDSPPPPPPPAPKKDWKTPRERILYTTRRWSLVPRASKRLEAKEHDRWVARMQEAIDAEAEWERTSAELGIDDKIAELRARKERESSTSTTKKRKVLTPRSRLLATGRERRRGGRGKARRNLAKELDCSALCKK